MAKGIAKTIPHASDMPHGGRRERMFGPRDQWADVRQLSPAAAPDQDPDPVSELEQEPDPAPGLIPPAAPAAQAGSAEPEDGLGMTLSGFAYIRCPECGATQGAYVAGKKALWFCTDCGGHSPVSEMDLRMAYVNCPYCGAEFRYKTNLSGAHIKITCHNCGQAVPLDRKQGLGHYHTRGYFVQRNNQLLHGPTREIQIRFAGHVSKLDVPIQRAITVLLPKESAKELLYLQRDYWALEDYEPLDLLLRMQAALLGMDDVWFLQASEPAPTPSTPPTPPTSLSTLHTSHSTGGTAWAIQSNP